MFEQLGQALQGPQNYMEGLLQKLQDPSVRAGLLQAASAFTQPRGFGQTALNQGIEAVNSGFGAGARYETALLGQQQQALAAQKAQEEINQLIAKTAFDSVQAREFPATAEQERETQKRAADRGDVYANVAASQEERLAGREPIARRELEAQTVLAEQTIAPATRLAQAQAGIEETNAKYADVMARTKQTFDKWKARAARQEVVTAPAEAKSRIEANKALAQLRTAQSRVAGMSGAAQYQMVEAVTEKVDADIRKMRNRGEEVPVGYREAEIAKRLRDTFKALRDATAEEAGNE